VELLVAMALLGCIAAGVAHALRTAQRSHSVASQQADLRQTLQGAAELIAAELRDLDATDGDIVALGASSVTIRAPRQLAFVCRPPAGGANGRVGPLTLTLRDEPQYGVRDFNPASDSLWIAVPTGWVRAALLGLWPDTCPDSGPGRRATIQPRVVADIPLGAPVSGYETVTYLSYRSSEDGRWYLGIRNAAGLQPLFGPLAAGGLQLVGYDSAGAVTADPAAVVIVATRLRAETRAPSPGLDSLVTRVHLRNNRR
jgi:hypothetical protein